MTIQEFEAHKWGKDDRARHRTDLSDKEYPVCSVDFEEALIGVKDDEAQTDDDFNSYVRWFRCEHCALV